MTLARQLLAIVSLLFVVATTGTLYLTVDNTRLFLAEQLESHAQDTATSLGLSLSLHLAEGDVLLIESIVDAIFDRGYYRSIVVEDVEGHHVVDRVLNLSVAGVPHWFVRSVPLVTPSASARIMSGWRQGGTVTVVSHPGFAYEQLWRNAVDAFWWSVLALALAITLTGIVVRAILRPLRDVESQALAISMSEFPRLARVPRTRELARVVTAMNSLSSRMEELLGGLARRIRELRDQTYADVLTGLGNRRAFERDVRQLAGRREEHAFGACLQIALERLDEVNEAHGYEAGDALILAAARVVADADAGAGPRATCSRIGGGLFAIVAPDLALADADALAARLAEGVGAVQTPDGAAAGARVALAWYDGGQDERALRDELDVAVRAVAERPAGSWYRRERSAAGADDAGALEARLREAIASHAVVLHFQPMTTPDGARAIHYEVLARVRGAGGELVPAGAFLPIAKRAGLAPELDRVVVLEAIARLRTVRDGVRLAVNLSPGSIEDADFVDWLDALLERERRLARRLDFEFSALSATHAPQATFALAKVLRARGARFGLDHFGRGDFGIEELHLLDLAYAKIDGAFVTGIDTDPTHRDFVRGCVEIGRGTGVDIVAEHVATEAELEAVAALGVSGVQGYRVGRPGAWDDVALDR